jgi:hypothetical protein
LRGQHTRAVLDLQISLRYQRTGVAHINVGMELDDHVIAAASVWRLIGRKRGTELIERVQPADEAQIQAAPSGVVGGGDDKRVIGNVAHNHCAAIAQLPRLGLGGGT